MPAHVGMTDPGEFIAPVPKRVPQSQNSQSLEIALEATAAWGSEIALSVARVFTLACANEHLLRNLDSLVAVRLM